MTVSGLANTDSTKVRIFIIRHGQTDYNKKKILQGHIDVDINEEGTSQAKLLGERLHEVPFDHFITSDLVRCRNTAKEVLKYHGHIAPIVTPDLREREMGVVEGMSIDEAKILGEKHGKHFKDFGETLPSLISRVQGQWDSIVDQSVEHGYKNFGFCTHGGAITAFVNHLHSAGYSLGAGLTQENLRVPYNTSVTVIDVDKSDKSGLIQYFGDTTHLGSQLEVADQSLR